MQIDEAIESLTSSGYLRHSSEDSAHHTQYRFTKGAIMVELEEAVSFRSLGKVNMIRVYGFAKGRLQELVEGVRKAAFTGGLLPRALDREWEYALEINPGQGLDTSKEALATIESSPLMRFKSSQKGWRTWSQAEGIYQFLKQ